MEDPCLRKMEECRRHGATADTLVLLEDLGSPNLFFLGIPKGLTRQPKRGDTSATTSFWKMMTMA
eukprot:scaffold6625_cov139-Skeletonema_marinoi.AAC.3